MDVRVKTTRSEDLRLTRNDVGPRADDQSWVDTIGDIGIPTPADPDDPTVADADIGAHDAPVVKNHHIGDHRVQGPFCGGNQGLIHRFADRLTTPKDRFLTAEGQILLDLNPQIGVAQSDLIPDRRAEEAA